ncbi:sensor histidine kinase [Fundidesulfovibrio terrae]|uniref:sensor histidine kinase n=1 Tax=Fundidesulfovibrio terrae TaxID=2922866 RepID=UPI001FAEB950|nr:ATP-binding protein [Fundidesulfovibrio terrae]
MTIKKTLILHGAIIIGLLVLTGVFAVRDVGNLSASSRYMEIQERLNSSFLEMRLSEKNYFLFKDDLAIDDILVMVQAAGETLDSLNQDMVRAIGLQKYQDLRLALGQYRQQVERIATGKSRDEASENILREAGRRLMEVSNRLTEDERTKIGALITKTKQGMLASFLLILILAVFFTPLIYRRILASLNKVSQLAMDISEGRFRKIDGPVSSDELGAVIRAMNTMSEQLRLREDELVQSRKLNSLGILTAGVAHEITNPLNNISMIAQTYEAVYDILPREERIGFMRKVTAECERIQAIVINLLDFAKPKVASFLCGDVNDVVRRTLQLVRNMLDVSNIEVVLDLAEGLPCVRMDEHQICQVFVNIITNAIQAMSPGQTLAIRTKPAPGYEGVVIDFQDTGKGIPPEILSNIFDPFFSTKGVDGTGLGLSVSYGIIKNHLGTITAQSEVNKGTTFEIVLPAAKPMEDDDE